MQQSGTNLCTCVVLRVSKNIWQHRPHNNQHLILHHSLVKQLFVWQKLTTLEDNLKNIDETKKDCNLKNKDGQKLKMTQNEDNPKNEYDPKN